MSARVYVDTNVYLDYFEDRRDGIRPLGEFAFAVFRRALECEFEIMISDLVIKELGRNNALGIKYELLIAKLLKNGKLLSITTAEEDTLAAKEHKNYNAALHAVLAKRSKCHRLVTRNIGDFLDLSNFVEPILPEQL